MQQYVICNVQYVICNVQYVELESTKMVHQAGDDEVKARAKEDHKKNAGAGGGGGGKQMQG